MSSPDTPSEVIHFGEFELDTASGELRRRGLKIRLPDQSFQVLRLLLSRPDEIVTREELRRALWTSETFVDFDVGLNSAIRRLRDALGDSAENPRFVETMPRRGYRFIGARNVSPAHEAETAVTRPTSTVRTRWIAGGILATLMIGGFAVVLARGGFGRLRREATPQRIQSVAVLPFVNLTGDASQEYFVDAVTDAVTTHLALIDGVDVTSGTSARQYRRTNKRVPAIAKDLNVDAVLEGAVARTGDHVRITAQLIHAATDRHVWARNYDGDMSDILTLQQRIASDVGVAAGHRPAALATSAPGPATVDPQAYDAYLKGIQARGLDRFEGFRTGVAYFEEAVRKQPDFAAAHAALAQTQVQFLLTGPLSPREITPKAEAAARRALELDERLVVAHLALGQILALYHWNWDQAEKEFRRAAELSGRPDHLSGAATLSLIQRGRIAEAVTLTESARKRDPLSFGAQLNVATAYRAAGQHDRALAEFRRALEMKRDASRAHFHLGITYVAMGRIDDAVRELEATLRSQRDPDSRFEAYLGWAYAAAGRPDGARSILQILEARRREQYVSSFGIGLIHDALGEKEPALAAIERAYEERAVEFGLLSQYPPFKTVASEPRYQAVMARVGLPH